MGEFIVKLELTGGTLTGQLNFNMGEFIVKLEHKKIGDQLLEILTWGNL